MAEKKVKAKNPSTLFSAGYEIFMALLSLLSIFNMILLIIIGDPSLSAVLTLGLRSTTQKGGRAKRSRRI